MIDEEVKDFNVLGYNIKLIHEVDEFDDSDVSFPINDSYVELYGNVWELIINNEKVFIREGTWFEKDEDGEWQPDWSLSWFYYNEDDPSEYLYFEQDGASAHTCSSNKKLIEDLFGEIKLIQNPSNSPDIAYPIENIWG